MFDHNGITTNNFQESYNSKLGAAIKAHPNPYLLASLIRDELQNAVNDAKDHKELRAKLISMLDFFVNYAPNRMEWPFARMSTEDWASRMSQDEEWGDDVLLSLDSHVLNRRIIISNFDRPTSTDLRRHVNQVTFSIW
jgi:hypothetical protein